MPWPHRAFALLLLALALLYFPWTWSDQLATFDGDSAVYVLTAKAYAPFASPDPLAARFASESQFPPLYPAVLAIAGGGADLHWAHAATTLCLLLAFAAVYAWCVAAGLREWLAFTAVALFAVAPGTYVQALLLHSESLYVALSLAALALLAVAERPGSGRAVAAAAAGAVAAAMMTRSAGVALMPALLIVLVRRRPTGWPLIIALASGPTLAWSLVHHPAMSYGEGLATMYGGRRATDLVVMLAYQALSFVDGLARNFAVTPALLGVLGVVGLPAIATAVRRFVARKADAWYFFAYAGLIVLWPWPGESRRFAWVVAPLVLGYAFLGADELVTRFAPLHHALRALLPLAMGLVLIPGFELALERRFDAEARADARLAHLPDWYEVAPAQARRHAQIHLAVVSAVQEFGAEIPADACAYTIKPAELAVLAHRDGRLMPNGHAGDAEFDQFLRHGPCRYALGLALTSPAYGRPYYPIERIAARAEILDTRRIAPGDRYSAILAELRP